MTTIREQFLEVQERLTRRGTPPVRVVFSEHGYTKMLNERTKDATGIEHGRTYMGLPFSILPGMKGDIGLHCEYEPTKGAVTLKLGFSAASGHVTVNGEPYGDPIHIMQVIGNQLDIVQMSDLVQGFIDAHPNEQPMTDMLVDWLQTYGRFE